MPSSRLTPATARLRGALAAFVHIESAGAIVLLAATVAALALANSPAQDRYDDAWHREISLAAAGLSFATTTGHFVNEGLMALFFFLVALEVKRELTEGELASPRRAALPVAAAAGGMVVPAAIYAAFNAGGEGARGWGIPMATDIAFAVGIITLAGRRVPAALKLFLLALAIADDLGAIAVIALFYTGGVEWGALGIGAALVAAAALLARGRRVPPLLYLALGPLAWLALRESGLHATIAGVAFAAITPGRPAEGEHDPLLRVETALHPLVSFAIVPLFAFANAGLDLGGEALQDAASSPVSLGVLLGLVAGKPAGIVAASWLAVRLGLAHLPAGTGWRHVAAAGTVAGVGFTVSLFVTGLAFSEGPQAEEARLAVLGASVIAGALGYAALRVAGPGTESA